MTERSARELALHLLNRIDRDGAWAHLVLPAALDRSGLSAADRRFVTDLVAGTTRMRRACDASVDRFIVDPPDLETRNALRLGAYQLAMTRVPEHAAVHETVALVPRRQRGFVNAVLRRVAREPHESPDLATRLSYPDWIVARLVDELGRDEAVATLEAMNRPPVASVRDDGYVQDPGSRAVVAAVEARPGEMVADLCAAPGGKATGLAAEGALVVAADVHRGRSALMAANAEDVGSDRGRVSVVVADARCPPLRRGAFDAVLLDAPCSGLGVLRRRADARWRIQPREIERLAGLQGELLNAAAHLVRPGGWLVYSVCTLTAAECLDHDVPAGFERDERSLPAPWQRRGSGWMLLPHLTDTDGMLLRRFRAR